MGKLTIAHNVTGQLDGQPRAFQATQMRNVRNGVDTKFIADNSWKLIAEAQGNGSYIVVLINEGEEDALFRFKTGADYSRFTLPAGAAVSITLRALMPLGTVTTNAGITGYQIAVYSANGTTIRAIVAS